MAKTVNKTFSATATAEITEDENGITVTVFWQGPGIDHLRGSAWGMTAKHAKLAQRLASCIRAQAYITLPKIITRDDGSIYISDYGAWQLLGRTLNAELRRRGF